MKNVNTDSFQQAKSQRGKNCKKKVKQKLKSGTKSIMCDKDL